MSSQPTVGVQVSGMPRCPREVEDVLYEHPAVHEAAVIGVPDAVLGEEVGAAVVVKPGMELGEAELISFVPERVTAYKYPRRVWFAAEPPKGATGKILKREILLPAESGSALGSVRS